MLCCPGLLQAAEEPPAEVAAPVSAGGCSTASQALRACGGWQGRHLNGIPT